LASNLSHLSLISKVSYIPVVTETIVTVLEFEHRERAEILVQMALFFSLSIPFLSNFVSIVSVTTGIFPLWDFIMVLLWGSILKSFVAQ
jgi:hypothetical protein